MVYMMTRASTQLSKQLLPEVRFSVHVCIKSELSLQPIEKMNEMVINCKTLPKEV